MSLSPDDTKLISLRHPRLRSRDKPPSRKKKRKIPPETRAQLYQLELTLMETRTEIRRLYDAMGFSKSGRNEQRQRIMDERGL